MTTPPEFDCLSAGIVVADHVCAPVESVPGPGELVISDRLELSLGGCAANVAVGLAQVGHSAAVAGRVGDDVFGQFLKTALQTAGVNCRYLLESPGIDTAGTLVINTRGEDRRFIHSFGANAEFSGRELTADVIGTARILYLGGYCLNDRLSAENVEEAFQTARQTGVRTVLDIVIPGERDWWPMLEPVLPQTDLFVPNMDEARLVTGLDDPAEQAARFRQTGAETVVVTCGERGAVLLSRESQLRAGVYATSFVDGTGSGDAFVTGMLYGLLQQADWRQCLRFGSAMGASAVQSAGATTGLLNAGQLEQFVQSHELPIEELAAG